MAGMFVKQSLTQVGDGSLVDRDNWASDGATSSETEKKEWKLKAVVESGLRAEISARFESGRRKLARRLP
jgi:hypothetical protein